MMGDVPCIKQIRTVSGPKNVGNRHTGQCGRKTRLFGCDGQMIGRSLRKNVKEPIDHIRSPNRLHAGRCHTDILLRLSLMVAHPS
jgi:hypothetical protein